MEIKERWRQRIKTLKIDTYAIYLATKDPRVPWYVKAIIFLVVGHTLSPIDLIPDFIPVIGYLDDLIITPIGIAIVLRLIPEEVFRECQENANKYFEEKNPRSSWAGLVVILIWLLILALVITSVIKLANKEFFLL